MSFDIYFFPVPRFAETTKINFGFVCRRGIDRVYARLHPRLVGRFITIPFREEIHNKKVLYSLTMNHTTKLIDFFIRLFIYFTESGNLGELGFHIFEITGFARVIVGISK